jgi:DNA-binding NarL/FixJ family response regulator
VKKRILIADEADLMLIGIETVLQDQPTCEIVHVARSASELIEMSETLLPDVIVFNERLDAMFDVLVIVEQLQDVTPRARLIVLGGLTEGLLIRDLFASGVLAYLYAGDNLKDHLLPAIHAAVLERPYLSPTANSAYLLAMKSPLRDWQLDREARTVLRLLMQGAYINEIASQMNIPMRRAYFLRHKLKQRFGATTNEHLISRAIAEGFITPEAALEKQYEVLPRRLSKLTE